MGQKPYILTTEQQPSLILTIPEKLFTMIASFMNTEFQLAFAQTCKAIYAYHKKQCKEETFTLVRDPQYDEFLDYKCIKALERYMSQTGWASVKITLNIISVGSQNNYNHPIKALCLNESLKLPNGLDCESLNTLIIDINLKETYKLDVPFFERFSNLESLYLRGVTINDDTVSMLSKLPLLKFFSLNINEVTKVYLSKIFEGCTTLEEFQLCCDYDFADMESIKLPPQLKRYEIDYYGELKRNRCLRLYTTLIFVSLTCNSKITAFVIDFI